jgi:hypothetical protein
MALGKLAPYLKAAGGEQSLVAALQAQTRSDEVVPNRSRNGAS